MTGLARCHYAKKRNRGNRERRPHHSRPFISLGHCCVESKRGTIPSKYREMIAAGRRRVHRLFLDVARAFQITRIQVECCRDERFVNALRE